MKMNKVVIMLMLLVTIMLSGKGLKQTNAQINTGLRVVVTQPGLNLIEQQTIQLLESQVVGVVFPGSTTQKAFTPIGDVMITVWNLEVTSLNVVKYSCPIVPGTGFDLDISQVDL